MKKSWLSLLIVFLLLGCDADIRSTKTVLVTLDDKRAISKDGKIVIPVQIENTSAREVCVVDPEIFPMAVRVFDSTGDREFISLFEDDMFEGYLPVVRLEPQTMLEHSLTINLARYDFREKNSVELNVSVMWKFCNKEVWERGIPFNVHRFSLPEWASSNNSGAVMINR